MKRFTDTEKWQDPWFRKLTPSGKVFWIFILDNCDNAGVWDRDDDLFKIFSGITVEVDSHIEELGDRVEILEDGKVLIPKFVQFQQGGDLKESKPFHRGILKLLEKHQLTQDEHGIVMAYPSHTHGIAMAYPSHSNGIPMAYPSHTHGIAMASSIGIGKGIGKGIGNGKGEESEKGGETPETEIPPDLREGDLEETWNSWHLHLKDLDRPRPFGQALIATLETFRDWGVERSSAAIRYSIKNNWYSIHEEKGISSQNRKVKIHESDHDNPLD